MTEAPVAAQYRSDIDGLRAIAVVAVVLFHADIGGLSGGYVGVDVFFVISGFLIARLILGQVQQGTFSLVSFWERRIRRIFPALFVVTLVSCALAWRALLPVDFVRFGHALLAQSIFSQNILFWSQSGYFQSPAATNPLLHTWTLAVEEQFYVLFPLALYLLERFAPRWLSRGILLAAAGSFLLSVSAVHNHPGAAFFWLPPRAWELLLGVCLNFAPTAPVRTGSVNERPSALAEGAGIVGLALIAYSVTCFNANTLFPGLAAAAPCGGAALVIWSGGASSTLVARALSRRPLVAIGLISYSLYLWHMPVLAFWRNLVVRQLTLPESLIAILLATGLAWVSYTWVETPVRRRVFPTTQRLLFIYAFAGVGVVVGLGLAIHFGDGFRGRFASVDRYLAETYLLGPTRPDCPSAEPERSLRDATCLIGRQKLARPPAFVLWGDSHADALLPAFDELADRAGLAGYYSWSTGCPPIVGVYPATPPNNTCLLDSAKTIELIRQAGVKQVILVSRWSAYVEPRDRTGVEQDEGELFLGDANSGRGNSSAQAKQVFTKHLKTTVDSLLAAGASVWIVKDVPEYDVLVPKKLINVARLGGDVAKVGMPLARHLARQGFVSSVIDALAGPRVHVIDPTPFLCEPADFCRVEHNGWSLYKDDDHLSPHGAQLIEPAFDGLFAGLASAG